MAKETILFKSEERKDLKSVADFLRQLADKIETGEVVFQRGDEEVRLKLATVVDFEIKAEEKPKKRLNKQSLEIELEWYEGESGAQVTLG